MLCLEWIKIVGFIFKSIFWVGIVCLFLPRDPAAIKMPKAPKAPKAIVKVSTSTVLDAASAGASFCRTQPEICESAIKTGAAGRDILTLAARSLSGVMSDKAEKTTTN